MLPYSYRDSLKSTVSDELINTYLLRPLAGLIVWLLYSTPVTPNQITIASIIVGLSAAIFYLQGTYNAIVFAGLLITLKDLLDSADGQLARARQQYSRVGRFLDSIGDFVVDVAVFGAIGWVVYRLRENGWMLVFALLGLMGITLRVSYHVFYHTSYLHVHDMYSNNRITEEVRKEDLIRGGLELVLQRIFQFIYGWQDRLIARLDTWSAGSTFFRAPDVGLKGHTEEFMHQWYSDIVALRLSGLLGFGTEFFLLMLCSVFNKLELYLTINIFFMNGVFLICILYRRYILFNRLQQEL